MSDVRDDAMAQMGLALAQAHIDRALALARLTQVKASAEAVMDAIQWEERDGGAVAVLPADMVITLQAVVTTL